MTRPTRIEVDCSTGVETIIEYTDEEIAASAELHAQWQAQDEQRVANQLALEELKASAKAKLVAGTPLTEEEAATIVL